jgi:CRP-like cAMP-binding protein
MNDFTFKQLSVISLFNRVDHFELRLTLKKLKYSIKVFNEGEIVEFSRSPLKNAYFLLSGQITANMETPSGKILQIEKMDAPKLVAAGFLFSRTGTSPVDVFISEKTSKVLFLPYDEFLVLLRSDETIMFNFLRFMGDKLNFLSEKIRIIGLNTLTQKVCSYLFSLYKNCGEKFQLPITKEEMANLFGSTRPSVSRVFGILEKDGVILRDKKDIVVTDCKKLLDKATD